MEKWQSWIGTAVLLGGLAWAIAGAWFALEKRVSVLELEQRYSHGDVREFLK